MSGFIKKCGLFPFNPSAVDVRQLAPSKAFRTTPIPTRKESIADESACGTNDEPSSPLFTKEQENLYSKRFVEGYDLDDPGFVAWLKINHPDKCVSATGFSTETSSSDKAFPSTTIAPCGSVPPLSGTSDVLSEVLVLPHLQAPKRKKKTAMNSRTVCITTSEELKKKEKKKN